MTITNNYHVACSYELYAGDDTERTLIEEATKEAPLEFIHGIGLMLDAFEKHLEGLKEGDHFDFVLTPDEAFGPYQKDLIIPLEKRIFVNDEGEFDSKRVTEGNFVPLLDQEGNTHEGLVQEITDTHVVVDFNHPFAGETLHYIGDIITARPATQEELDMMKQAMNGGGCSGGGCSECSGGCH